VFCDIGHFSILHTDTFGNGDVLAIDPYTVRRTDWSVEADYRYPSVNPVAEPGPDGRRPVGETFFQYRIELPFAVWLGGANGPGADRAPRSASDQGLRASAIRYYEERGLIDFAVRCAGRGAQLSFSQGVGCLSEHKRSQVGPRLPGSTWDHFPTRRTGRGWTVRYAFIPAARWYRDAHRRR
jgi:hypothetical protein